MAHDKLYGFDNCKCQKEVLSKAQIQKDYIRTYKSLGDLNADVSTRLDTIVNAMETPSVAMYTVTAEDGGYYPVGDNRVIINKYADGNFDITADNNGLKYTKDSFTTSNGSYDNSWSKLSRIIDVIKGTIKVNPNTVTFRPIVTSIDLSNVIPVFNFRNLNNGFTTPPNVSVQMSINTDIIDINNEGGSLLMACVYNHESFELSFDYVILLIGV
jgi:hypothetical protein